jgi:hypothetical protein
MLKVLELDPAGTTTLVGTVAAALLLVIATVVDACTTAVS